MCMEQEMLCFSLLISVILVVFVARAAAAPQHSLWTLSETQKPLRARCWGPGTWPHPAHCRLFSVCHLDWDGSILGHLFLCPLGSSYSSRTQHCIVNQTVMPECATSLEDNSLLVSLSAEQLSSNTTPQLRCGEAQAPYCADNEILVICTPNKVFVGYVNCSVQQWAKNTEPLQCNKSRSMCATSPAWQPHQDSAIQTSTKNSSAAFSQIFSSPESAVPNSSFLLHVAPNHTDLNLHLHNNKSTTTNTYLQMTLPDMSTEGNYNSEFYVGDQEYEVYDLEGSLPDYPDIRCTQKGLQCADNTTIMDCYKNFNEPFFIMSCNSLLYSDDGENVVSHCDNETSSCILTSKGMTVTLKIKRVKSEDLKICESYSGLQCVNNEMLIACSGDASSTHYTVSCNGVATSETDHFLQGQCHENSCMFATVHQTNISDIMANHTENYDTYRLVSSDTNSTTPESPFRNTSKTNHLLPPDNNSSATKLLYTNINATYLWPTTDANSAISESLQTNRGLSYHLLLTDNDSATSESIYSNTSITYYLMPPEADSTINESLYSNINVTYHLLSPDADSATSESPYNITGVTYHLLPPDNDNAKIESLYSHISSATNTIDIHEEPDIPVEQVEMFDLHDQPETIKYNLSEAGDEYFVDNSKTEVHITNSPSSGNSDLITDTAEKILQTAQDDSSQINDYLMPTEETPTHIAVVDINFELLPPPTGNSLEVLNPADVGFHSETYSLLNLDHISVTSETNVNSENPTIPRETISFVPEIIPKEPTILISKSIPTETYFSVPETVPTKIMIPVSNVIPTETSSVPETLPTEITVPVSKFIHTENDFPVRETLPTEIATPISKPIQTEAAFSAPGTVPIKTVTPISKLIHTETAFSFPEADYTEITTPVSKLISTETVFTVPETLHTEMTPASNAIHTETAFSATETVPTENVMLVSKLFHIETAFSVPENISTDIITHISKLIPTEIVFPMPETVTREMTPVSKSIHTEITFSVLETVSTELTTPVSRLIPIETVSTDITTSVSKLIPTETVFPVPETVYTEITPLSKPIHTETAFSVPETVSDEITTSVSKLIATEKVYLDPDTVPTQITPVSKTVHTETAFFATETMPTGSAMLIIKPIHKETAFSVPKTVSTGVNTPVSNVIPIGTASPVPETIPTQVIMPASKLILTETAFSDRENIPTQAITPLSQPIPTKIAFPFSGNIPPEATTPVSKLIPTETASPLPETKPTQATPPVSKFIPTETASLVPETVPTETTTLISKSICRETASSFPEPMPGEFMNFNSDTTVTFSKPTTFVTEDKISVSNPIPVTGTQEIGGGSITDLHLHLQAIGSNSAVQSASETITSKTSAHESEFISTRITPPTSEMDQSENLVTASNPAVNRPLEVSDIQQNNVCQKVGIHCIDSLTLGACLPDLTLSYTVSCQILLPYVMSERHVVYCNKQLDTCAVAPLL